MIDFTGHTIGRYKILERIGQGGMAVVYKALDTRLDNEVALKFIKKEEFPASAQEGMLQRFEREARLMASLNHPNIVKVMDYGEYDGYPYLVMPYLAGGTLKTRMGKPLPWRDVIRIILPLTQALEYAHKHQKGALHRDIKPSNILMTESGEPILTDFGIAKILEKGDQHTLTGTGTGMGTPEYMAPEQWIKKVVDGRADVYALGTVMYELLTGRQPFIADTPPAIMLKKITETPPRPRMLVADLPEKVEQVVLKALAKEPDNRYPSMGEFGRALESLTAEPKPFKLPKWVKPVLLGLLGVGVLTSCIAWLVIPGVGRIQTYLVERGQTATAQAIIRETESQSATQTAIAAAWTATPSKTPVPSATLTETPSPSPSPTATLAATVDPNVPPACTEIGLTWVSPLDGMTLVCVPAGEFMMGNSNGDDDERPEHLVYLDAYWMDQTEVTNEQFAQFVSSTGYQTSREKNPFFTSDKKILIDNNWQHPFGSLSDLDGKGNHPVVQIFGEDASAYCAWAGRKLPTEAQWEKAARGTDGRIFPWGNEIPTADRLNYDMNIGDTTPVGQYSPLGDSPYGCKDMAGNTTELVQDIYDETFYSNSPKNNPLNYSTYYNELTRGGAWYTNGSYVRSTDRWRNWLNAGGFRCSYSTLP